MATCRGRVAKSIRSGGQSISKHTYITGVIELDRCIHQSCNGAVNLHSMTSEEILYVLILVNLAGTVLFNVHHQELPTNAEVFHVEVFA